MSVSDEIIKVLDAFTYRLGIAVDWTSTNIIPYFEQLCQKFVTYEIATSIFWLAFGLICLIFSRHSFKKTIEHGNQADWDGDSHSWFSVIYAALFVLCIINGLIVSCCQILDIVECISFPELVVFNELKTIMNTIS